MTQRNSPPDLAGFSRLRTYFTPYTKQIVLGLLFLVGASLMEPLIPAMMKLLLDHTASAGHGMSVRNWPFWGPPLAVIAVFSIRAVLVFLANLSIGSASNKASLDMQRDTFGSLLTCEAHVFQKESASSLTHVVRSECIVAGQSFVSVIQEGGRNLLTAIALTGYLFWMNWKLTLITLAVMPLTAFLIRKVGLRIRRLHQNLIKTTEALGYVIEENTAAYRMIRLYGAQDQQKNRFMREIQHLKGHMVRALAASTAMTPLTQIAASVSLAMILAIALSENKSGDLTVGGLAAYITAMLMLIAPLKGLGDVVPAFQRGRVAAERIFEVIDYPKESSGGTYSAEKIRGEVRFDSVVVTYPGHPRPAVDAVSLHIHPRQMVALVGASGSGKTTLASTLPLFVRPDNGRILLDGVNILDWNLLDLRKQVAMVSQDTILFNDTILANVSLGSKVPDTERAVMALKQAHLWPYVSTLPDGICSIVGHNGQFLSGGQRQRLSIARALYKQAPVLILDEATSALDSESEQAIQSAISGIAHQCTMLVIAHRLSTVKNADSIVVMNDGQIVEQGTYDALIKLNGWFAKLVGQQMTHGFTHG